MVVRNERKQFPHVSKETSNVNHLMTVRGADKVIFLDTTLTFFTGVVVSPALTLEEDEVVGLIKAGIFPFLAEVLLKELPADFRGPNSGLGGDERKLEDRSTKGFEE